MEQPNISRHHGKWAILTGVPRLKGVPNQRLYAHTRRGMMIVLSKQNRQRQARTASPSIRQPRTYVNGSVTSLNQITRSERTGCNVMRWLTEIGAKRLVERYMNTYDPCRSCMHVTHACTVSTVARLFTHEKRAWVAASLLRSRIHVVFQLGRFKPF